MLEIKNVVKTYGDKVALKGISLKVKSGTLFGFIGHNGAGKTTLLKAICGIHSFDKGEILVDGISIKDDPIAVKERIAYVPDNPELFVNSKAIDYLNFIGNMYNVPEDKRKKLTEKYANMFGIYDVLGDYISSYSHGMRQKLAIIGALIHEPKLLILDEPFVGLDPVTTKQVKDILRELCDNGGTVFFSSHVLEIVEKLCDEIAIIKEGEIVVCGKTEEVTTNNDLETVFLELIDENK